MLSAITPLELPQTSSRNRIIIFWPVIVHGCECGLRHTALKLLGPTEVNLKLKSLPGAMEKEKNVTLLQNDNSHFNNSKYILIFPIHEESAWQ